MKDKRIILIGAGNVAHHLAPALLKAGLNLCQIYSRSIESARELGRKTGITYTADLFGIYPDKTRRLLKLIFLRNTVNADNDRQDLHGLKATNPLLE